MSEDVPKCQHMSKYVQNIYLYFKIHLLNISECPKQSQMSKNFRKCPQMSSDVLLFHKIISVKKRGTLFDLLKLPPPTLVVNYRLDLNLYFDKHCFENRQLLRPQRMFPSAASFIWLAYAKFNRF